MSEQLRKSSKSVCPVCERVFEWKSGLSRHLKTAHTTNKGLYKCNNCSKSFLTLIGLNVHQRLHTKKSDDKETGVKKKISEIYKSTVTETLYSSDSDCEYEVLQTVIKINNYANCSYSCVHCDRKFIRNISLKRHVLKRHKIEQTSKMDVDSLPGPVENMQVDKDVVIDNMDIDSQEIITTKAIASDISDTKYNCTQCNATFKELSHFTNHRKLHLKKSMLKLHRNINSIVHHKFSCQLCKRKYSQKIFLENHMRLHESGKVKDVHEDTVKKMYLCTFCGKQFGYSSQLSVHVKLHVDGKKHLCGYCGKAFALRRYLINHQKIHTQEKQFACKYCDKRFIHKGALVEHQRIHEGIKPFECTICSKTFTHYSGLTQHLQTHTDEKKHVCNVCGKSFRFGGHYREHMRTHTGEKPFTCNICSKGFALRGSLVVHLRRHSGERPFKCDLCKKGFVKSYNLKQHMKRSHKTIEGRLNECVNTNVFIPENKEANS